MTGPQNGPAAPLNRTSLYDVHVAAGGRMVSFAGFEMPLHYAAGILKEHLSCRSGAGLFDVSHMGQAELVGPDYASVAAAFETLVPADVAGLAPGRQRYTQLLTEDGGIIDDLMVARPRAEKSDDRLALVVNASRKSVDYAHIAARLPEGLALVPRDDLALIAIQGPEAEAVLVTLSDQVSALRFMDVARLDLGGAAVVASRSGYTGEDGFEISLSAGDAPELWQRLAADERVTPVGLGARDSLRLEAGLCLYGADLTTATTPIEAGLAWSIQRRRREEGGFPGDAVIQRELATGPLRMRVGLRPEGRTPIRPGTALFATQLADHAVGYVTSGSLGPSLDAPVAMGYIAAPFGTEGNAMFAEVRGRRLPVAVAPMPFVPARFKRN